MRKREQKMVKKSFPWLSTVIGVKFHTTAYRLLIQSGILKPIKGSCDSWNQILQLYLSVKPKTERIQRAMIFRLTEKLAKKIKLPPLKAFPISQNPFIDWTAHLFTAERAQYIIVTNTASLYSLIMHGRGITNDNELIQGTLEFMQEYMVDDGCEFLYLRLIDPHSGIVSFAKATNRHVIGSMNELILEARFYMTERRLSPYETSQHINETPMSYLDYNSPNEAFRLLKVTE